MNNEFLNLMKADTTNDSNCYKIKAKYEYKHTYVFYKSHWKLTS